MEPEGVAVGQEVSLGGYPDDWLLVDRAEGTRLRVRRSFGEPLGLSSGFWINDDAIRNARWPTLA